jgi:hypothetical protein
VALRLRHQHPGRATISVGTDLSLVPADAALVIDIMHGGGGEDSHMNCQLQGTLIESNGGNGGFPGGSCTNGTGAYPTTAPLWTDHWYLPGPIVADVPVTSGGGLMPKGLDYAGGRISGTSIINAGYQFACRYITDGGNGLPSKQLTPAEAADLRSSGVDIVSNWESTGTTAQGGFPAGVTDAKQALINHFAAGGPGFRPIYFSIDWDTTPEDQTAVNAYFQGVASVIGLQWTGIYGGFWPVSRALDAGVVTWAWQTQAWSGGNQDPRINILQENNAGYAYVGGVQCDVDTALTADYGQWSAAVAPGPPPAGPPPSLPTDDSVYGATNAIIAQLTA